MPDGASISALVAEHGTWLMAFLRGLVDNAADAEDAFQEVWVRLAQSKAAVRDNGCRAYLVKTARSVVIDRFRRYRPTVSLDVVDEDGVSLAEELADASPGPDQRCESHATADDVRAAIQTLPSSWRQVVLMRVEGELEFREIAEELQVPLGTVLAWMNRATAMLKRKLWNMR